MRKFLLLFFQLLPFFCLAQLNLKKIRTKSWITQAYKVSAKEVELYLKWDSIPLDKYIQKEPLASFDTNDIDVTKLGLGYFVLISAVDNKMTTELVNNSDLILLTINNKHLLQLDVRDKEGNFIENAKVFVDNKEVIYYSDTKTYKLKQFNVDEALVKIFTASDTLFKVLTEKDDLRYSISEQRRKNYKYSKIYKFLNWTPSTLKKLFSPKRISNNIGAGGYIIFNQPKYKPKDTLKFKAYIVNKKWKQYKKKVDIYINYSDKNKTVEQFIKSVQPTSAGAYVDDFLLADTLPLDTKYIFILKNTKGKRIISNDFKIKEYVLDEIGSYNFKSDKEIYYRNDSLRFFASAKDANGLNLLDGKATLLLTTNTIKEFYKDTVIVIDTLFFKEVKLNTTDDTKFIIPATILPHAYVDIDATLTFKNANNELHEEHKKISFKYLSKEIVVTQIEDSIKAVFLENGIE